MKLVHKILDDKFYRDTIFVFIIKVISSILGFTTTIVLVRSIGEESSSLFFFLTSITAVLTAISTLGYPDALVKLVAIKSDSGKLVRDLITKSTSISLLVSLTICLASLLTNMDKTLIFALFLLLPLSSISLLLASFLQGKGKVVIAMMTSGVLQNLTLLISLLLGFNELFSIILTYAIGFVAAILTSAYFLNKFLNHKHDVYDKKRFNSTCKSLFISQCIIQFNNNSAILMLGVLWANSAISVIAVSLKLTTLLSFVIISINKVIAPNIAKTYSTGDREKLQSLITKSSRMMWLLCLPSALLILTFSKDILSLINESYSSDYMVLIVLIIGQIINVLTGNIGLLLSMTGHEKIQRNILIFSLVFSTIFGLVTIPLYGLIAAASMVTINTSMVNLTSYFFVLSKTKINTLKII